MINKRNAVITTVIMGCVSLSDVNACCKGVPEGIKDFELLFNNLDGCTYEKLSDFFKNGNGKKGIKGKDIHSKFGAEALSVKSGKNLLKATFYEDDKKALQYVKGGLDKVDNGKDCKLLTVMFKAQDASSDGITENSEKLYDVEDVKVEDKKGQKVG